MKAAEWSKVVWLEIGDGNPTRIRVSNSRQAAECLLERWSRKNNRAYKHAVMGCSRALKGLISDEIARIFLVEAAKQANYSFTVTKNENSVSKLEAEIAAITDQLLAAERAQISAH
ncbi:MAG: DUF982 domain-containing protein [Rhizobiaceae bacterium]|nr:DUF982 domain-containing protein [Rhizobiaceae bacterium]